MTYPYLFSRPIRLKPLIVSRLLVSITLFSWIYVGANTAAENLIGALFGILFGLLFQMFVFYVLHPNVDWLLSFWLARKLSIINVFLDPAHDHMPPRT